MSVTAIETSPQHPVRAGQRVSPSSARWRFGYRRLLAKLVALGAVAAMWAALAPPQLGGWTSYVMTEGVSMLPRYHFGDLVILRKEPNYHVGEVAAYRNAQLRVVVMHRIVAMDGDRYVFKGDNNQFADTYEPTKAQIVGAEWLHLKGAARLVFKLRQPIVAAVFLGLLWLVSVSPPARSRRRRRRHRHAG